MNRTPRSATYTLAISLLLVASAAALAGATFAPGSPLAGFGLTRLWRVLPGQARAIPVYVLTLIRSGAFVAAMLI